MPALARQNSVRPQASAAATDDGAQDPAPVVAASGQPLSKTWSTVQHFLKDCQPLAGKLDANDTTKTDRKAELKRLAEHAAKELDEGVPITALALINAQAVQSYCDEHAQNSQDKYCKSSCAWLGLIATAQGHDDLPAPVCREMSALESLCADTEAKKRDAKPAAIDIHTFFGAGAMLFKKLVDEHSTMKYADLALAVWCIVTIFGIPARARTFRNIRWGESPGIKLLSTGDWVICLGDCGSPGTKHKFPMEISLSELTPLGTAGLSRPDLVCAALGYLLKRTQNPQGRLVFSRMDSKDSRFGKDAFGRYFGEKVAGLKVEELRTALESKAATLLGGNAISPRTRSLVSYLQQHKPQTAGLDYVRQAETEAEAEAEADGQADDSAASATKSPPKFTVHASYVCTRVFELERDVREAYKFEVEDNKLTIWWEEDSEPETHEIDPDDIDTDSNCPNKVTIGANGADPVPVDEDSGDTGHDTDSESDHASEDDMPELDFAARADQEIAEAEAAQKMAAIDPAVKAYIDQELTSLRDTVLHDLECRVDTLCEAAVQAVEDDSSSESDDESVADDVIAALRQGFILKPRARRHAAARSTSRKARRTRR